MTPLRIGILMYLFLTVPSALAGNETIHALNGEKIDLPKLIERITATPLKLPASPSSYKIAIPPNIDNRLNWVKQHCSFSSKKYVIRHDRSYPVYDKNISPGQIADEFKNCSKKIRETLHQKYATAAAFLPDNNSKFENELIQLATRCGYYDGRYFPQFAASALILGLQRLTEIRQFKCIANFRPDQPRMIDALLINWILNEDANAHLYLAETLKTRTHVEKYLAFLKKLQQSNTMSPDQYNKTPEGKMLLKKAKKLQKLIDERSRKFRELDRKQTRPYGQHKQ